MISRPREADSATVTEIKVIAVSAAMRTHAQGGSDQSRPDSGAGGGVAMLIGEPSVVVMEISRAAVALS
ncbi:MAG: hypothetical protein ABI661_04610 [Gammaproteobacteria bacterium]